MNNLSPLSFSLVGKTALVTGAAGGTGRAITAALAAAGASRILGWDRIADDSPNVEGQIVDLSDTNSVEQALADLNDLPSIVVNAAGFYANRPSFDVDTADFRRTLDINLTSPYIIQREIGRRLIEKNLDGAFINISSVAGKHAFGNQVDYVASKAGLIGLTRAAALDLAPYITVNGIAPGTVDTPMISKVIEDVAAVTGLSLEEQREAFISGIPTKRMQQPNEIAAAVVFLASIAARSITGEVLNVDGGSTRD
ncbi:NAD(P)-dependent dehydrogenase (short-subunit alcohol dehydrogenase family) [Paenarthrobacter nicotinovorans]|uniref:NAD(P)-dependent dehydrogenase (Short-subunit alcohol dehydrogenase family) n=1 Tax=Paenarthrobacter nicotinovorans TaxID=29320 RepID=A0ABT9TS37_PAENI|nr:SDR family oxidoreductase [Paenarthrobacter nicotinovorans]MDQ0104039.1 NAD(P)-dependent dehydrogenase (short-subunit alcohol dehydrogenase family) [Paenarthrobacter nicotinovorans]